MLQERKPIHGRRSPATEGTLATPEKPGSAGVTIPKDPPTRTPSAHASSAVAASAALIFKKLQKENNNPSTSTLNHSARAPLRPSDRNTTPRLTPQPIKKPTTNVRPTTQQRKRQAPSNRIPVVTDEEVPVTMIDTEHNATYTKLQYLGEVSRRRAATLVLLCVFIICLCCLYLWRLTREGLLGAIESGTKTGKSMLRRWWL